MRRSSIQGFVAVASITFLSSQAYGAKVLSMKPDKGVIVLDEGKAGGFVKGGDACVYDASDAELVCGKVTSVTAKNTSIRVPPDKMTGVEKGLTAKVKDGTVAAVEEGVAGAVAGAKKKLGKGGKASNKYLRNFKLMYVPGLVPAPFTLLSLGFSKDTGKTDYKELGNNNFGLIGLGLELELPVGTKSLAVGLRYRIFAASTAQADLSTTAAHFWETTESGKAIGLWFDYYFMHSVISKSTIFKLGSGLDIDQSTVTLASSAKTDGAALPATAIDTSVTSKVGVISLRIPASLLLFFDPIGINLDVVPMIPLVEMGSSIATSPEGNDPDAAKEFQKTTLKHKKASIAADIRLGIFFAF